LRETTLLARILLLKGIRYFKEGSMRKAIVVSVCVLLTLGLGMSAFAGGKTEAAGGGVKIGLSFAEFEVERWSREKDRMTELALKAGASDVVYQVANNDVNLQNSQIENMVAQGVKAIIIVAIDGEACAIAVDQAAKAGVACVAYDRLIKTNKLAAYITFDNVEVGRQEAQGVLDVVKKGRFALLGGSPTDNNAHLVRRGQMEVLKPLIDKKDIQVVGDQFVEGWSQEKALVIMENFLTANQNRIDAVVASNDSTGLGAVEALAAQGLAGKVPVSGQDATAAACKAIAEGKFTVTVFKDINLLSPMAVDIAMKSAKGQSLGLAKRSLAELTGDKAMTGDIPCAFLKVVRVTKDNLYEVVIKSGFQPYDEVYKDVPADKRPPKP
jgi:D-xylose transport system substrate-binding protein